MGWMPFKKIIKTKDMEIKVKINKQIMFSSSVIYLKKEIAFGYAYTQAIINIKPNEYINLLGLTPIKNGNTIRVYNIEKKKAKRVRDSNGSYKKISETSYTAHIYDIPIELLKLSGLSVEQKTRHFVLKKVGAPVRK